MKQESEPIKEDPGFKERIDSLVGQETNRVNDFTRSGESEEEGTSIVTLESHSNLEEDLAQMNLKKPETSKETQKDISVEVYKSVLKTIGEYIPTNVLSHYFPGIDLNDLDNYPFERAKIRIFLLSKEAYKEVVNVLYPEEKDPKSLAFVRGQRNTVSTPVGNLRMVDVSERSLIIVQETGQKLFDDEGIKFSEAEKNDLRTNIKLSEIHELLHILGVGRRLTKMFTEAVTEWYTNSICYQNSSDFINLNYSLRSSYPYETRGITILNEVLLENDFTLEDIDLAFVSNDIAKLDSIKHFFSQRYGEDESQKIFEWNFMSSRQALNYIQDLEIKQNSKVGEFLRLNKK
jgi:hypothetical protein